MYKYVQKTQWRKWMTKKKNIFCFIVYVKKVYYYEYFLINNASALRPSVHWVATSDTELIEKKATQLLPSVQLLFENDSIGLNSSSENSYNIYIDFRFHG